MKMRVSQAPHKGGPRPCRRTCLGGPLRTPFWHKSAAKASHIVTFAPNVLKLRCTGIAHAAFRFKSVAQSSHLLTFSPMSFRIPFTGMAYDDFRFSSAAEASHLPICTSMSHQIHCTGVAYADFRVSVVSHLQSLRTKLRARSPPGCMFIILPIFAMEKIQLVSNFLDGLWLFIMWWCDMIPRTLRMSIKEISLLCGILGFRPRVRLH